MTRDRTSQRDGRGRRGPSLAVVAAAMVAAAIATAPTAVNTAAEAQAPVRLELTGQRLAFGPDGEIRLDYRLTGISAEELELFTVADEPTAETVPPSSLPEDGTGADQVEPPPPPEPPLELTIEVTNYQPLDDPDDVAEVVGSDVDPAAFSGVIDGVALDDLRDRATVDDDGSIVFTLEIGTDVVESVGDRLKFERPGLHPLRVQLLVGDPRDDNVVATAGTVVQRLPGPDADSPPSIDLSVVSVVPAPLSGASATDVAAARRALDATVDLAAELDAPTTLEVPPTLVADAASTAEGSQRLADALRDDELVALPLLPLDVSSAVAAGRADAFTRLVTEGEDVLTEAVPTTPSLRTVWITTDELSGAGAQQLRDLGVRFVIMPAALYTETIDSTLPDTSLFVEAALPDGGTLPLLVVDPLAAELTGRSADDILRTATPTEWSVTAAARLILSADRADAAAPGPPARRSIVLTTPDLSAPDGRLLGALDELSATTPSLEFVRASSLIGLTDTTFDGDLVALPDVAGPSLVERVALLDATALSLASAASMLPPDDPRIAAWQTELDTLISTGYSDLEVEAVTAGLRGEADAIRDAVVLPEPFTFTLTGRSGTIEVRIGNTSTDPLTVDLRLESPKVLFPEGDQTVTLRPGEQNSVVVPVEARSNGTSPITLTVSTPAGEQLDEPVTLTSRVTGFTGLRQVLTGGSILVLLTWWFAHWRAKRRAESIDDGRERHPTGRKVGSDAL